MDENYIIRIDGDLRSDIPPKAVCTCGWETEPNAKLAELGSAAFDHREETGHGLRKTEYHEDN